MLVVLAELVVVGVGVRVDISLLVGFFQISFGCCSLNGFVSCVWVVVLVVMAGLVGVVQRSTGWGCWDWVVLFVVLAELVVVEVGVCSALLVGFFQAIFGCFNLNCFVSKVWGVVLVVLSELVGML